MIKQTSLTIDVTNNSNNLQEINDDKIIGPIDYGYSEYEKDSNAFTFGQGSLAGSIIPGTRRMMFSGFSPLWQNFYISTMGGAAYTFHTLGINYVSIKFVEF